MCISQRNFCTQARICSGKHYPVRKNLEIIQIFIYTGMNKKIGDTHIVKTYIAVKNM